MATNYTTNYDLCQWEPTDPVQRVEFNQDNAKVDAALNSLAQSRNCMVWTGSYTGNDADTKTLTFPHQPYFVLIMGTYVQALLMPQATHMQPRLSNGSMSPLVATWGEKTVTFGPHDTNPAYGCNVSGNVYAVLALLDPDN